MSVISPPAPVRTASRAARTVSNVSNVSAVSTVSTARRAASGREARGFALFVGVDADDARSADLQRIVEDLRLRLAEVAPRSESYAAVVVTPVGTGGRSIDVVRRVAGEPARHRERPGRRADAGARSTHPLVVDLSRREVHVDGRHVPLTSTELTLLGVLVQHPGRSLSREEIVAAVWSAPGAGSPTVRTVDVHVRRLRAKLGPYGDVVRTVRGLGYRFDRHPDVGVVPPQRLTGLAGLTGPTRLTIRPVPADR